MGVSTLSVGLAVTPTVVETWISHYLNRKPRREKPTAHISYDVGLGLIRKFLLFAASNTVEDIQAFTSQWVPSPHWVRTEDLEVPISTLNIAANHIQEQLGPAGIHAIGGKMWWQWRRDQTPLKVEWIEMRKDYDLRKKRDEKCQRSMLYVHGGAYYFGSVEEHRYQMQRHARKLQARVLAPRYRLAPQYPFPCGLQDCLAAYLYLLTHQSPDSIVLAGDSAGGGMVLSLLVILRDQGLPLPAGAILLSPWSDLTHSFPSVGGYNALDYVPPMGFHHKPSASWPPPDSDEQAKLDHVNVKNANGQQVSVEKLRQEETNRLGKRRASADTTASIANSTIAQDMPITNDHNASSLSNNLFLEIDGKNINIKDQIQMYTTNELISHPLVSPVLMPSLGGLPPLCILVGGGEMLRDEQIYIAHKAANPEAYPSRLASEEETRRYPPTDVQLQVWDDLCHVAPTLSFTRPAKHMYRSVAQFGAWALARAQKSEIRILDDDEVSNISDDSYADSSDIDSEAEDALASHNKDVNDNRPEVTRQRSETRPQSRKRKPHPPRTIDPNSSVASLSVSIGRAGDPIPPFRNHMIRQRVTRHGDIFPLPPPSSLPACTMIAAEVGVIKAGPVRKWLAAQEHDEERFGEIRQKLQKSRLKQMSNVKASSKAIFAETGELSGTGTLADERPPPTAWAGMRKEQLPPWVPGWKSRGKKSAGLGMWTGWGSKHDEEAIENEEEKVKNREDVTMSITKVRSKSTANLMSNSSIAIGSDIKDVPAGQSQSAQGAIHQREPSDSEGVGSSSRFYGATTAPALIDLQRNNHETSSIVPASDVAALQYSIAERSTTRAAVGGQAVPFKLARRPSGPSVNPSMVTLNDAEGTIAPHSHHKSHLSNGTTSSTLAPVTKESARASSRYEGADAVDGAPLAEPTSTYSGGSRFSTDDSTHWANSTMTSMAVGASKHDDRPSQSGSYEVLPGLEHGQSNGHRSTPSNDDEQLNGAGASHEEAVFGQAQAARVMSGHVNSAPVLGSATRVQAHRVVDMKDSEGYGA